MPFLTNSCTDMTMIMMMKKFLVFNDDEGNDRDNYGGDDNHIHDQNDDDGDTDRFLQHELGSSSSAASDPLGH